MDRLLALSLVENKSTPAERRNWLHALESLQSAQLHVHDHDDDHGDDPTAIVMAIARRPWLPNPADIAGLDPERASRLCRTISIDERAKALFRMLRTRCRHNAETPGKAVVTHPRVARGPNTCAPIPSPDSPVGPVRA